MADTSRSLGTGVNEVIRNLRKAGALLANEVGVNLKKAGLFLQGKSQEIVPVDLGPLKNSAFTRAEGKGFKTDVRVGYTMEYAPYVHEDLEARHKPGKTAKFLENPMRWNRDKILKIIAGVKLKKYRKRFTRTVGFSKGLR